MEKKERLRLKISNFVDGLYIHQLELLDESIKMLVTTKEFHVAGADVQIKPERNAAVNTFKPEDSIDYYYGRTGTD